MVALHPTRRSPRRGPQPQLGLISLRCVDEGDQRLPVVIDPEVLQIEIAVGLVVAVGLGGEIVGADRHAAVVETRTGGGVEEFVQHALAVGIAKGAERRPASFVEACAETFHGREAAPGRCLRGSTFRLSMSHPNAGLKVPPFCHGVASVVTTKVRRSSERLGRG